MKLKKLFAALSAVAFMTITAAVAPACFLKPAEQTDGQRQNIDYTESLERINNPDQGFYRPIYVRVNESGVTYNKNIVNASTQLYHLRIDISAFSAAVNGNSDKLLTGEALSGIDGLLSYLRESDKSAIVRFAYDPNYGGKANSEPDPQVIFQHINQVCPILNKYQATITAIEAGLIGPWGEMHTSTIANAAHITPIIENFLSDTDNLPVLVRTPKMIYDYLGITVNDIDDYEIGSGEKAYRLGMYNDGYLGSNNDLGTYTSRQREIEFLSKQTEHLPYGGEVVIPDSKLHDIQNCVPEMRQINLSYLNVEWNNNVIDKWKNTFYTLSCGSESNYYKQTAFTYIENRMGYRFVLTDSTFKYSEEFAVLDIDLTIKNVGFGNLNKTKNAKIIFVDENGKVALTQRTSNFTGKANYKCTTELELDSGNYSVYLRIYGDEQQNVPYYCVQFANKNIWNAELKANKIGEININ